MLRQSPDNPFNSFISNPQKYKSQWSARFLQKKKKTIPGAGIAEFHTPTRAHALLSAARLHRTVGNICEISLFIKRLFEYVQEKKNMESMFVTQIS